jgi:hypothetical protein
MIMVGWTGLRTLEMNRTAAAVPSSLNLLLLALIGDIPGVQT